MIDHDLLVAELEARVAALEALLDQRSVELRELQRRIGVPGLVVLSRVQAGRTDLGSRSYVPEHWHEVLTLDSLGVAEVLSDLWASRPAPAAARLAALNAGRVLEGPAG